MALFGLGKKKQSVQVSQSEPEHESLKIDYPKDQQLVMINGTWCANPNYDPSAISVSSHTTNSSVYSEDVNKFLDRNPDAKLFKLTGTPDDFAFYQVGNRCDIEFDDEKEKYAVLCGGDIIGYLPSSAVSWAKKRDLEPDFCVAIIAEVEYDMEKDRDVISVYIAE